MRIAILTFHQTPNYGAMLQTYALQGFVRKLSNQVEVLNYQNHLLQNDYMVQKLKRGMTLKQFLLHFLCSPNYNARLAKFGEFQHKFIRETIQTYDRDTICQCIDQFDSFIVGSDQVWNNDITGNDPTYLFDFVPDGKIIASYAASFGKSEIPSELHEMYASCLSRFTHISVRERQGAEIIRTLTSKRAKVVLDPIFLLSRNEWEEFVQDIEVRSPDRYILIYAFGRPKTLFERARAIAKEKGLKILVVGSDYRKQRGFNYLGSLGPREFVKYFLEASYIVTNSFHGTAFSINFNKEFYMDLLPDGSNVNNRLQNIIELFKLHDRQLGDKNVYEPDKTIDYARVNKILEIERAKSIDYLKMVIEDGNRVH